MREITREDYVTFRATHPHAVIEGVRVAFLDSAPLTLLEPAEFRLESTTVWSFEKRGKWATHRGNYRGNWAPEIPRNLLLRYTQPGDWVLDQMVGSGTTLIECKLLGRNGVGVDINLDALMVAWNRLEHTPVPPGCPQTIQRLYSGDARHLDAIEDASIDLIATHPPYANIIRYSKGKGIEGDLSLVRSLNEDINAMAQVAAECWRVLKPGKHCAILVGDTHRHKHYVPIAFRVMYEFLKVGFILREDVIKLQWHVKTERERWNPKRHHD
ncbi:MAG: DNA methyltransferase, partial [Chloroflexota bacterium]|nr:DNA methyltransferase [Chloroflexota bacterium]